jgi:hypothetical protein
MLDTLFILVSLSKAGNYSAQILEKLGEVWRADSGYGIPL